MLAAGFFALAAATALAQPSPTVRTTGEVVAGGKARFTVVVTNRGDDTTGELYLYDPLPGIGVVSWGGAAPPPGKAGCSIAQGNAPDPSQEVLECLIDGLGHDESFTVTVTSVDPVEPGCMSLVNEAFVRFPRPATRDYRNLPPPGASAAFNLIVGLCQAWMAGAGKVSSTAADTTNRRSGSVPVAHEFELRCKASDHRQRLEVDWPGRGNAPNSFRLVTLTSATCVDDPAIGAQPARAGFDTFIGEGWGWCNGERASIAFAFTDAGQPGTAGTAEYQIFGDACSLDAGAARLDAGDQQAHRN